MNAKPSRDPANDGTFLGTLKTIFRKFLQKVDDQLPAIVESHDRAAGTVVVRPLISMLDTNGMTIRRDPIANIPVQIDGGGGFFVSYDLPPGSFGWIKANDRDISLFKQSFKESKPNTRRLHSFSDAVFIPYIGTGYQIASEDSASMVIQNLDGTVKIALDETGIRMTSPDVKITAETAITIETGTLTITAEQVSIDADTTEMTAPGGVNINGVMIDAAGNITTPAAITAASAAISGPVAAGALSAAGKDYLAHVHPVDTPNGVTQPGQA